MNKVFRISIIILIMAVFSCMPAYAAQKVSVIIDHKQITLIKPTLLIKNVLFAPIGELCKPLGFGVTYKNKEMTLLRKSDNLKIKFSIGNKKAFVGGKVITITPPVLVKGSVYIPLTFIVEASSKQMRILNNGKVIKIQDSFNNEIIPILPQKVEVRQYDKKYLNDVAASIREALMNFERDAQMDVSNLSQSQRNDIYDNIKMIFNDIIYQVASETGVPYFLNNWEIRMDNHTFDAQLVYDFSKARFEEKKKQWKIGNEKATSIIKQIIQPGMDEYERELAIHDYIVNNTIYDIESVKDGTVPDEAHTVYGALVLGDAVCDGYAKSMNLLLNLAGVESMIIEGKSNFIGKETEHAWNIAKIDGKYYQLDATWDDPVGENRKQVLNHDFFNITDDEIAKNHTWNKDQYPKCISTADNYFSRNNLVAENHQQFVAMVKERILNKDIKMTIKVKDYSPNVYKDFYQAVFFGDSVKSYSYSVNDEMGIITISDLQYTN
jgi:hypothetical protein